MVSLWVPTDDALVERARGLAAEGGPGERGVLRLAAQLDLGAMDALHAAAALQAGTDQFVTMERPSKPLFRVPGLNALSLHPQREDGA
jgi:hypothetical protein